MPRTQPGPPCQICQKPSVAKNLCGKHYKRKLRHGHTGQTRPEWWGNKEKHELYNSWCWHKKASSLSEEWMDFWAFVEGIGNKPSEQHRLKRYDNARSIGPDNWYWKETSSDDNKASSQREWRKNNPERVKDYDLQRMYGISYDEYHDLLEQQNGKCSICKNEEHVLQKGKPRMLAVDHCHDSGKVRGLLCTNCNKGLGHFKDNIELLEKAIYYLKNSKVE
jgi:hypothetical protein